MKKEIFEEQDGSFVVSGVFDRRGLCACALTSMHCEEFRSHDVGLVCWITARRLKIVNFSDVSQGKKELI